MSRSMWLLAACCVFAAAAPAAAAPSKGCSSHLAVAVDKASLTASGTGPYTATRIEAFRRSAGARFKAAADAMCKSGTLKPAALRPYKRLLIQSGAGADSVAVYSDPSPGRGTIVFQWAFGEANLALPPATDVRDGLSCWVRPNAAACAEREP